MAKNTVFNKVSYTSRTYDTILSDLIGAIPSLTDKWKNYAEDDPGIVLLKLAAFTGDMLSYNMDFQVGETFPQSATQRKNAAKIYDLIGYKMHWYRSASCLATFQFNRPEEIDINTPITVTFPQYTSILTPTGLSYVMLGDDVYRTLVLPSQSDSVTTQVRLLQGYAKQIEHIFPSTIPDNGRIYFPETNVDEDNGSNKIYPHMSLKVYSTSTDKEVGSTVWYKVDNLLTQSDDGWYYEFDVDENDQPYIQLVANFRDILQDDSVYLNLTYVLSEGTDGAVSDDVGFRINLTNLYTTVNLQPIDVLPYLSISSNTQSDAGHDPETCIEAVYNGFREALTLNTAVTLSDFATYAVMVDGIRACRAIDRYTSGTIADKIVTGSMSNISGNYWKAQASIVNYYITPGSVILDVYNATGATDTPTKVLSLYDKDSDGLLYSTSDDSYSGTTINYTNGQFSVVGSSWAYVTYELTYTPMYAPYTVALQLVMNDYHYLPTYDRSVLSSLIDTRKIACIQYIIELAKTACIPYNIVIHSTEPYSTTDTSIVDYMVNKVNEILEEYYNSNERSFGDLLNYSELTNLITDSDTKIELTDIQYPLRNLQIDDDKFPRLGQTAINVEGDPDLLWLQDNIFSIQDDTSYQNIRKALLGWSEDVSVVDKKVNYSQTESSGNYTLTFVLPTDSPITASTSTTVFSETAELTVKVIKGTVTTTYTAVVDSGTNPTTGKFKTGGGSVDANSSINYNTGVIILPIGDTETDTPYILATYTYKTDDISNGTLDYSTFLGDNSSLDNINTKLIMPTRIILDDNGEPAQSGTSYSIEWWCSRDDLVTMEGIALGNLKDSEIIQDTDVTFFFKILKNKASMVFTEPIEVTITQLTESYGE